MPQPKYSLFETERRWLVQPSKLEALLTGSYRQIEDRYLVGTQLRLRKIVSASGEAVFKLCKKYGKSSGPCEAMTNLYLSADEHAALSVLPAAQVIKRRYSISGGSVDLYENPNAGLAVFEMEFESPEAAARYEPPAFVGREITDDLSHSGAALAKPV